MAQPPHLGFLSRHFDPGLETGLVTGLVTGLLVVVMVVVCAGRFGGFVRPLVQTEHDWKYRIKCVSRASPYLLAVHLHVLHPGLCLEIHGELVPSRLVLPLSQQEGSHWQVPQFLGCSSDVQIATKPVLGNQNVTILQLSHKYLTTAARYNYVWQ